VSNISSRPSRTSNKPPRATRRVATYRTTIESRRTTLPLKVDRAALKLWRRKRYMAQKDLASLIGVGWETIQRWELGESNIPGYLQLILERLDEIMLWHPDGPRMQDGKTLTGIETASPPPPQASVTNIADALRPAVRADARRR